MVIQNDLARAVVTSVIWIVCGAVALYVPDHAVAALVTAIIGSVIMN